MSFRRIGGINRSSNNHIVSSEYNTSSKLISQNTFVGDLSCNSIIVEDISINGNIFISKSDNIQVNLEKDMSFNNLDVSENIIIHNQATIFDASINNNLDVSENLIVNKQATIYDVSINNNLDVSNILTANVITVQTLNISSTLNLSDVSINHLDITSHLFAPEVSFNNLDVSDNFYANDASINHLDITSHLFAPEVSFNNLDVSDNFYANDASINHLDITSHLFAPEVSFNNLDVSDNLTVNGNAVFNGTFTVNDIDISGHILGINSGEASGNIGLMMQTDSSNVFFGYDASENMCFLTKTQFGPDTSFNIYNTLEQDSSTNLVNNLVNLQVNTLKAQNLDCANFTITANTFDDIKVNDKATIENLSVQENINCGKAIKLENNTFSVGSMVSVSKDASDAILETDYNIYVTDKWAIYVFDNSGNYSMNLNVLEEDGVVPDISLGYIICGGGEGGGTGDINNGAGFGGSPGNIDISFINIQTTQILNIDAIVGYGGNTATTTFGGEDGTSTKITLKNKNSIINDITVLGGNDNSNSGTALNNDNNLNYNLNKNYKNIDGEFEIKLGGIGGDGNKSGIANLVIDASFGGGGGGGSIDNSNNGIAGNWGIKGTKKCRNGHLVPTDFIYGSNGEPYLDPSGGKGGRGYYGGGGGGGGIGDSSLNSGLGGKGGDGVVCIIIDKVKFGSVIKDVEEIQCGKLGAFQIETTKLKTKSDYRLKTNVEDLQEVYNVDNLRPVMYNINSSKEIGLIAHEIQEYYPFLVSGVKDGKEMQTVNYNGLIGVLIKEIQLLKSVVREQSELVREQGNEIKLLKDGNN